MSVISAASSASALTDSRLAALCAETEARNASPITMSTFDAITQRARERFLARDWHGSLQRRGREIASLFTRARWQKLTTQIKQLMGRAFTRTLHLAGE